METHEIRYFLAVCRARNFTKAAASCSVSQPALTRAIKKLEGELGGALFDRAPSGIELTRLGLALLPGLEAIESNLAGVRRQADEMADSQLRAVRIGVMCTVGPTPVIDLLQKLRQDDPGVDVTISDVTALEVVELLLANQIDVGITAQPSLPPALAAHALISEKFVVALREDHPLASQATIQFNDLAGLSYLERLNCEFDDHFEALVAEWPIEFNTTFASEREDWIQALIVAGEGIAIVPERMACLPGVVKRRLIDPEIQRTTCLVTMRGRPLSPIAQSFVRRASALRWTDPV